MPSGYSRSPKLIKGALIYFSAPMLQPVPNIVVFQYNPESMTRTLTPWKPAEWTEERDSKGAVKSRTLSAQQINQLAQPFDPQEEFSVVLELDAADGMEDPAANPVTAKCGVADRLAALEMLCYPPEAEGNAALLKVPTNVSIKGNGKASSTKNAGTIDALKRSEVPVVIFSWGPDRIVPVRLKSFSAEEQQYSPTLYPLRAKVTVGLKVLDKEQLVNAAGLKGTESAHVKLAKACYDFTRGRKKELALANRDHNQGFSMGTLPS